MKMFDCAGAPSPRRVRIFLAEKEITDIPMEQVDVFAGEQKNPEFLARNPYGAVPVLELDDGTCVSETMAICRYVEETRPGVKLLGETPQETATIEMWQRRVENSLFDKVAAYFHHATEGLGELEPFQVAEWGHQSKKTALGAMQRLDERLQENDFIAGKNFTVADITALCGIDFATALGIQMPSGLVNLAEWHQRVSARASAAA